MQRQAYNGRALERIPSACYAFSVSSYGASFVRIPADEDTSFRETCRLLRESQERILAASPMNVTVDHTVRASEHSDWLSITSTVSDQQLATISSGLHTTALTLYAQDEKILRFGYSRFENGRSVRALRYVGRCIEQPRGAWVKVEGEPEAWEATCFFSPELTEQYRQYAPEEVSKLSRQNRVMPGFWIPWAADLRTVAEIARSLQLPWNPARNSGPSEFPPATQTEIIPGSPEREREFLRKYDRPWWKFWS